MQFKIIHNKGQARLFRNKYLECLTKTHPLVIWSIYIPIISYMLYYSYRTIKLNEIGITISFAVGIFFWTFFEYIIHRFAFHFISRNARAMKLIYIMHGNHHEYPRDKNRLFMPPVPSVILAASIFALMYFLGILFGISKFCFSFFPGFIFGYLIYGTMHYAIHAWNPPFKWMKPLWRNHHLHHYKESHKGFGVSTTLWDRLFGTMYNTRNETVDEEKERELKF